MDEAELQSNAHIQQLASLNFYKKPVQLEDENNNNFLGFTIHADNRQIHYILHPEEWRYRLPTSAGSVKLRLSGYSSRLHLIKATAFPETIAQQQIANLENLYDTLGYTDHRQSAIN